MTKYSKRYRIVILLTVIPCLPFCFFVVREHFTSHKSEYVKPEPVLALPPPSLAEETLRTQDYVEWKRWHPEYGDTYDNAFPPELLRRLSEENLRTQNYLVWKRWHPEYGDTYDKAFSPELLSRLQPRKYLK